MQDLMIVGEAEDEANAHSHAEARKGSATAMFVKITNAGEERNAMARLRRQDSKKAAREAKESDAEVVVLEARISELRAQMERALADEAAAAIARARQQAEARIRKEAEEAEARARKQAEERKKAQQAVEKEANRLKKERQAAQQAAEKEANRLKKEAAVLENRLAELRVEAAAAEERKADADLLVLRSKERAAFHGSSSSSFSSSSSPSSASSSYVSTVPAASSSANDDTVQRGGGGGGRGVQGRWGQSSAAFVQDYTYQQDEEHVATPTQCAKPKFLFPFSPGAQTSFSPDASHIHAYNNNNNSTSISGVHVSTDASGTHGTSTESNYWHEGHDDHMQSLIMEQNQVRLYKLTRFNCTN